MGIRENELEEEDFKEENYPITGKLMAYCTDHAFSHINWVYYLRAVFEWNTNECFTFELPFMQILFLSWRERNSRVIFNDALQYDARIKPL